MKQTNDQFIALVGCDIFMANGVGTLRKVKVLEFIYDTDCRSLKINLGEAQNYTDVIVSEKELEKNGRIMVSDSLIKAMRHIEGDFKDG